MQLDVTDCILSFPPTLRPFNPVNMKPKPKPKANRIQSQNRRHFIDCPDSPPTGHVCSFELSVSGLAVWTAFAAHNSGPGWFDKLHYQNNKSITI